MHVHVRSTRYGLTSNEGLIPFLISPPFPPHAQSLWQCLASHQWPLLIPFIHIDRA